MSPNCQGHHVTRLLWTSSVNRCLQLVGNKTKMYNLQAQHRHRPCITRNSHNLGLARLLWGNRVSVCSLSTASMSGGRLSGVGGSLPTVVWVKCRAPFPAPATSAPWKCPSCGMLCHRWPPLGRSGYLRKSFLNVPHPESPNHGYKAETGDRSQEDHSDVPQ